MQGDVFALTDMEGNVVIEYNYDPWGRITYNYLGEGNGAEDEEFLKLFTAIFCPLTYRGYNYDFTTGLYYLQSRYYNPNWGRFLNVDDTSILLATQGETHGANLFAYCENNPVNKVDYTGRQSVPNQILIPVVITAMCGVVIAPLSSHIMTMSSCTMNWDFNEKYEIVSVTSSWTTHKWYRYEHFFIKTFGGPVKRWRQLIDDIEPYLTAYEIAGIVSTATGPALKKAIAALGGLSAFLSKVSGIAFALGITIDIAIALIGAAKGKIEKETRGMSDSDWYIFNWKVDYHYQTIFSEPQQEVLYYYTPLALICG